MKIKSIYSEAYSEKLNKTTNNSNELILLPNNYLDPNSKSIPVDPAIIELIIGAGKLILSMMDTRKDENSLDQIGKWVNKIANELNRMNKLLEDIRQALSDLKIYINQSFTNDNEFAVLGICQTYIDNLDNFKENLNDLNIQSKISQIYLDLQQSVRKLMQYGFSPAFTISYAYMVEADLIKLTISDVNRMRVTQQKVIDTYSEYFDMCLDKNLKGSYTQRLFEVESIINKLITDFTNGDKGILITQWIKDCYEVEMAERHRTVCEVAPTRCSWGYKIQGDLQSGFSGILYDAGTYADSSASNYTTPNIANQTAQNQLNQIVSTYNSASVQYRNSLGLKEAISVSINNLNAIQELIRT